MVFFLLFGFFLFPVFNANVRFFPWWEVLVMPKCLQKLDVRGICGRVGRFFERGRGVGWCNFAAKTK